MNIKDPKYKRFALCREMMETGRVIRQISEFTIDSVLKTLKKKKKLLITGEGSSRLIPGKNLIYENLLLGSPLTILTDGATQALEYKLDDIAVVGISNSGKTKEAIRLFQALEAKQHASRMAITSSSNTPLKKKQPIIWF